MGIFGLSSSKPVKGKSKPTQLDKKALKQKQKAKKKAGGCEFC